MITNTARIGPMHQACTDVGLRLMLDERVSADA